MRSGIRMDSGAKRKRGGEERGGGHGSLRRRFYTSKTEENGYTRNSTQKSMLFLWHKKGMEGKIKKESWRTENEMDVFLLIQILLLFHKIMEMLLPFSSSSHSLSILKKYFWLAFKINLSCPLHWTLMAVQEARISLNWWVRVEGKKWIWQSCWLHQKQLTKSFSFRYKVQSWDHFWSDGSTLDGKTKMRIHFRRALVSSEETDEEGGWATHGLWKMRRK